MNRPFTQSLAFSLADADADAEDADETTDTSLDPAAAPRESPTQPPPSQVRSEARRAENDRNVLRKRLSDPRLRANLLSYLIKKRELVPDLADEVVQQTYLRALNAGTWPDDEQKMLGWMIVIADRIFIDDVRKRERRGEVEEPRENVDLVREPPDDEEARHVAEVAGLLATERPELAETLQMIQAQAAGEPLEAVLAGTSISERTFYRRRARFVAQLKKRLVEIASMTTSSLGLMLFVHMLTVVTLTMVGDARPVPGVNDPLPTLQAHEDAGSVRERALDHCQHHAYGRCLELLNRAKKLDPEGDAEPKVVSARHDAEKAVREGAPTTP